MGYIDILQAAVNEGAKNHPREPGDYEKDGLLYCGKCRTPKQISVPLAGGLTLKPFIDCVCEKKRKADAEAAEKAEEQRLEFEKMVKANRDECFPEGKLKTWTFENDDGSNAKYINAMKRYVANFEEFKEQGRGTILYGTVGTGKTYLTACVANALLDKGYKVIFTSMSRIERTLQSSFTARQEYIDLLSSVPLVVIDDIGAERNTEYMREIVYSVIDARYIAGLPLIGTTNLTLKELTQPETRDEQRIYGRLLEMCYPIEVIGRNKRQEKMMDTYAPIRDILGI